MIDKFKLTEKSKSEIITDEIINGITNKLWLQSDYATAFYLGVISNLKHFAKVFKEPYQVDREVFLKTMSTYKTDNVPDEIKNLIDTILEEFDYKEN